MVEDGSDTDAPFPIETSTSPEDDHLTSLLKEYELSQNSLEELNNRIIQVIGVGIGVISLVAGYVLSQGKSLSVAVAWLTPSVFFMFFSLLMLSIYQGNSKVWVCRLLSWRINSLLPETSLVTYEQNLPPGIFFSVRRGNFKLRIVYTTLIMGSVLLFLAMIIVSFGAIYSLSHPWGTAFVCLNALFIVLGLVAVSGIFYDLPQAFRRFQLECEERGLIFTISDVKYVKSAAFSLWEVVQVFIPRSWDFAVKSIYVAYGALAAY